MGHGGSVSRQTVMSLTEVFDLMFCCNSSVRGVGGVGSLSFPEWNVCPAVAHSVKINENNSHQTVRLCV